MYGGGSPQLETFSVYLAAEMIRYLVLSLFLSCVIAGSIENSKNLLQNELRIFQKCMKDGNVSESVLDDMFKKRIIPETRAVKCLLGCHMKGMGYLSDNGKMDWSKMDEVNKIEYIDPAQVKKSLEATEACRKKVPQNLGNICDAGFSATKCFFEEAKSRNLPLLGPDSI